MIILGPKGSEVIGKGRKLHNKELNNLHSSPDIIHLIKSRCMKWAKNVARMGIRIGTYRVLVGKPD
jgi:hypothetical protein